MSDLKEFLKDLIFQMKLLLRENFSKKFANKAFDETLDIEMQTGTEGWDEII